MSTEVVKPHFCYRHRPNSNKCDVMHENVRKRLEALSIGDRDLVTRIWDQFTAAPRILRPLILDGLMDHCCLPQLSHISSALGPLLRVDIIASLPAELSIRILQYLDAKALCHAAQVSHSWRKLADDDIIWHRMCEQHIDKKCKKCGWGLPLMDKKRKAAPIKDTAHDEASDSVPDTKRRKIDACTKIEDESSSTGLLPALIPLSPPPAAKRKRPWKEIYAERLVVERNWRGGNYAFTELTGHTDSVMCMYYDEARSLLVTGSYDYSIRVWNVDTMECIKILSGHTRCVRGIQMDDTKIVSGSMDRTIRIWNMQTFECVRVLEGHAAGVVCLNFNGKLLATGSTDGTIRVWDLSAACCFQLTGHTDWVNKVQILDKQNLFSCSDDLTVKHWNLETRQEVRTFSGHVGQISSIQTLMPHSTLRINGITIPGGILVSASLDNTIKIWCLTTGKEIKTLFGHVEGVWCVDVDSLRIVSGGQDKKIIVWDIERGKAMLELEGNRGAVNCCCMTDTKIISGGEDGSIRVWDFLPVSPFLGMPMLPSGALPAPVTASSSS
ncbi:quinon protein alcohol dehydrogenase-like superfamily [Fimicolochytrium jonesii]|uniref:quinon protein alcohol dehydrogenase-like superfamily n=1 Tax=Fimicolochytrium jonesii TaxID=1396493 RepID=UPI0022FDC1DD|nr:quinon protein alcohol dehydrogenase-like superfamily [Fimicolochytrium jonesii]XP_052923399.1 quinon protein alcohol dehydrogenase-like superfamily [Fimicolochytrium jonesii]KAI8815984.1 quinon protein alcohol dehydrogenase-like superfamily [Fimicolochytrium jonesii]KAI8818431.1 quinon protein alcohol dehydrogenase-like superfamily [Fimicolochytrium jonesii]